MRLPRLLLTVTPVLIALAAALAAANDVQAATSPFGIATPDSSGPALGGPLGPFFAWVALRQAAFYRSLTSALTSIKADGWAAWLLLGLSFVYGVFHAVGPGHGKAVISGYLVSSGETIRRGIGLSFLAAMVQAVTAVAVVAVLAVALHATAMTMTQATDWFEIGSYALVAVVGAWLLWSKTFGGGHHHHHHHVHPGDGDHGHHGHDGEHPHRDVGEDRHARSGLAPSARPRAPIARVWSTIMAVGIRPCSGAIIVLVFALSQGLFLAGVAATFVMALGTGLTVATIAALAVSARGVAIHVAGVDTPLTAKLVRAAEIAAAAAVLLLGLTLLGGALASRMPG